MARKAGLVVLIVGTITALLVFLHFRGRSPGPGSVELEPEPFAADALAGYLPADSAVVVSLDLRALREAPAVQALRRTVDYMLRDSGDAAAWLRWSGIDPLGDLDRLDIVLSARSPSRPLWLATGRFDTARFDLSPGRLREVRQRGRRIYELSTRRKETDWVAPVGRTLAVGFGHDRLDDVLKYAQGARGEALRDPILKKLLAGVNRSQAVWLAASYAALGPVGRLDSRAMDLVMRPIFTNAESVSGGVEVGDSLRAAFTFTGNDEDAAQHLEGSLSSIVMLAQGAGLLPGLDRELVPLFQLLGSGEVTRDGADVTLRCEARGGEQD